MEFEEKHKRDGSAQRTTEKVELFHVYSALMISLAFVPQVRILEKAINMEQSDSPNTKRSEEQLINNDDDFDDS